MDDSKIFMFPDCGTSKTSNDVDSLLPLLMCNGGFGGGNWFSDGKDTGIPATPAVDEQLDNIGLQLQQHTTEITKLQNGIFSNNKKLVFNGDGSISWTQN